MGEYIFEGFLYTQKKGYYPSGTGFVIDEHNTKNIKMEPFDSWITFKINNQLNIGDTLWTKFWNKDKIPRYFSSKSNPL
ncbi:MAG TPA: hypothetical protein VK590_08855 [Saprospiraceae bacterium]|nr:hypothetical protein [Saprospiraceae bacterium]